MKHLECVIALRPQSVRANLEVVMSNDAVQFHGGKRYASLGCDINEVHQACSAGFHVVWPQAANCGSDFCHAQSLQNLPMFHAGSGLTGCPFFQCLPSWARSLIKFGVHSYMSLLSGSTVPCIRHFKHVDFPLPCKNVRIFVMVPPPRALVLAALGRTPVVLEQAALAYPVSDKTSYVDYGILHARFFMFLAPSTYAKRTGALLVNKCKQADG